MGPMSKAVVVITIAALVVVFLLSSGCGEAPRVNHTKPGVVHGMVFTPRVTGAFGGPARCTVTIRYDDGELVAFDSWSSQREPDVRERVARRWASYYKEGMRITPGNEPAWQQP